MTKKMIIEKGYFKFELPDEWITESKFHPLEQNGFCYIVDTSNNFSEKISYIEIDSIDPKTRGEGVPIFNAKEIDGQLLSAKVRTVSILKAIVNNSPLRPVVVDVSEDKRFKFKIENGCHRLHCSIAAGFTHIPAVRSEL